MSPKNRFTALSFLLTVALCGLGILFGLTYSSDFVKLRSEGFGRSWKLLQGSIEFSSIVAATPDDVWAQSSNGRLYHFLRSQWIEIQNVPDQIYIEDLLQKSGFEFEVVNGSNQVEPQAKAFSPITVTFT